MIYKLVTDNLIAFNNDHIFPHGTKNDNNSSMELIKELREAGVTSLLDLGCAGGQFVVDCSQNGIDSFGIEGSDFNIKRRHPNWVLYNNELLSTGDISKPFNVVSSEVSISGDPIHNWNQAEFDIITAWEVIEHIPPSSLKQLFLNINRHLKEGGTFIGTISVVKDTVDGIDYHHSVFPVSEWQRLFYEELLNGTTLKLVEYPFKNKVRDISTSFCIGLKKKKRG